MITLTNLYKRFGDQQILNGTNLTIRKGEILALIGRSGEGKSVLLKHIRGLMSPDGGSICVDGEPIERLSYRELQLLRRRMGYVFQDAALLDSLTIRENLRLALDDETCACDAAYCDRRVNVTFGTVNLTHDVLDKYPNELSGGMRKRVGVARAIIHGPEIILYVAIETAEGLKSADPVLYRGVPVGKVKEVGFSPGGGYSLREGERSYINPKAPPPPSGPGIDPSLMIKRPSSTIRPSVRPVVSSFSCERSPAEIGIDV